MFMNHVKFIMSLLVVAILAGCASPTPRTYKESNVNQGMEIVAYGQIVSVTDVILDKEKAAAYDPTLIGAILGGVAGSTVGGGNTEHVLGGVAGVVLGGVVGSQIKKQNAKIPAYELYLRLDSGKELVVVQGKETAFAPGERIKLLKDNQDRVIVSRI